MTQAQICGVIAVLTAVMSFGVRGRDAPRFAIVGVAFLVCWINYISSFGEHSLAVAIEDATRVYVRSEELWAVADGLMAALSVALLFHRWEGQALWATYSTQCVMHVLYFYKPFGTVPFQMYSYGLDAGFIVQAAILIFAGSSGVGDWIASYRPRGRRADMATAQGLARAGGLGDDSALPPKA